MVEPPTLERAYRLRCYPTRRQRPQGPRHAERRQEQREDVSGQTLLHCRNHSLLVNTRMVDAVVWRCLIPEPAPVLHIAGTSGS